MKEALERGGFALWPGRPDEAALRELAGLFDRLDSRQPGLRIDPAQCDNLEALRTIGPALRDLQGQARGFSPIARASSPGQRRRVLQMDIAAIDLPDGLRWAADEHRRALEGAPALA
jgi:hypothetical protein